MTEVAAAAPGAAWAWLGGALTVVGIATALIRLGMWIADVNADRRRSARSLARIGRALARRPLNNEQEDQPR